MFALRKKEKVINKIITIDIPENFRNEVEIIILSDADEKKGMYWSEAEIALMGSIPTLIKDIDSEDYSAWYNETPKVLKTLEV
ncbi:MAG: hypothetical protein CO127_07390 [Ignavibacteria bacterium CG_4_9_14_3_um_filter_36_18]|nr:hypothetical protein [Ignavibacteria bacterium]PJB00746.1 MAG: hypothetical protein CO127_07390 [Ignavibacteria bacterium CG_4_9_14_3_um_filter_36_18]